MKILQEVTTITCHASSSAFPEVKTSQPLEVCSIPAQYVNCAAANSGADAGMYDASSEIYKLSTWQQVPHRGNPFRDKGGLRGQRQSGSCSKRHHVTREEDFSGRQRVFETLHDCRSIFLNQREYTTLFSLPPFPAENLPSASKN